MMPRVSYLPLLLPKLHAFFLDLLINEDARFWHGWFSFENVPLKWQFPVGLLFDIYSGSSDRLQDEDGQSPRKDASPVEQRVGGAESPRTWQLTVHFDEYPADVLVRLDHDAKVLRDAFTNSYKESSFVRYSSTKVVQRLSMDDALQLWEAVEKHDFALFSPIQQKMMRPRDVEIKNIALKIYLPATASDDDDEKSSTTPGHLRVIQGLVPPQISARQPQTLGTALNSLVPSLFPSRKMPLLAQPVLHGAIVPLGVSLDTLSEIASYADGFLHMTVAMIR
ncbi:hypothetical protein, variant 1 [Verruconis gallopava]|nr:hypothetical protein, variant 1 [Verruconis gallopava]KIW01474.1 hypothetical protein, variant 1 [Verruconis gallopava]